MIIMIHNNLLYFLSDFKAKMFTVTLPTLDSDADCNKLEFLYYLRQSIYRYQQADCFSNHLVFLVQHIESNLKTAVYAKWIKIYQCKFLSNEKRSETICGVSAICESVRFELGGEWLNCNCHTIPTYAHAFVQCNPRPGHGAVGLVLNHHYSHQVKAEARFKVLG